MDLTPWIDIARTGTFEDSNGREHTFTEADLEAIRAGYDPAKSEAPLVFGHPKDNAPAYGWLHALKLEGAKLLAQFAHVPAQVKKLVQDRHYRYVSMSLSPDKRRILHIGLLGAAAPAIHGLEPVEMNTEGITINFAASPEEARPGGNMPTEQELQQECGKLKAENKALEAKCEKLEKEVEELKEDCKELEEKCEKLEKELKDESSDFSAFKDKQRAARVQALVNSGKLEPAKAAETISFTAALAKVADPVNFSTPDGKQEQISAEERYFRELEAAPADPRFAASFTAPAPGHYQTGAATVNPGDITKML